MTARDVISPVRSAASAAAPRRCVEGDMPLVDVLPRLLDAPGRVLGVTEGGAPVGVVDESSLLDGLGRMIAPRDDSSVVVVECRPEDYSASILAHAVEGADTHLVDLWTVPADDGRVRVTLRVRCSDPSPVVHSLERYDFHVMEAHGSRVADFEVASDRLLALQTLLNV